MKDKVKRFCTLSIILSIAAIGINAYNFNGALSESYRYTNAFAFYGILSTPLGMSIAALVLGVLAWTASKVITVLTEEENPTVQ